MAVLVKNATDKVVEELNRFTVGNSCQWDSRREISLWELYNLCKGGELATNSDFLQRKIQTDEWIKQNFKRVKEWWSSVVRGNGRVDYFMLVPIDLIIDSLEKKVKSPVFSERGNVEPILQMVLADKKNNVKYYIVDGQNRLMKAIVPFFDNDIPFGEDNLIIYDRLSTGEAGRISLSGKYYGDLDKPVKEFLQNLRVPLAVAETGDIDSITDALIAKNTAVSWNSWQRLRTKNSFTNYSVLINKIFEKEDGGIVADRVLSKLGGGYDYEKDGYEKFISEMFIWMKVQVQPKKGEEEVKGHLSYFEGGETITKMSVDSLKKYLREFASDEASQAKNQHSMVRNYVMFRYAMDNYTNFNKIDIPRGWKINNVKEFVAEFVIRAKVLHKDPAAKTWFNPKNGIVRKPMRTPGYYPWACSEYSPEHINCRLRLLSETMKAKLDFFVKKNIIILTDTTSLPSQEEMYVNKPFDHIGNRITASGLLKKEYHRGHNIAHAKGGKNTLDNLELQEVGSNLSYGKETVKQ